ncbi:MAG: fused MFS/spermidine synthase [Gemmatimonadetes bacterium]|nr:fused MFS/spermidine synthase [Gemmatimonadota bacterium]MDA1102729.1 fused MFS/spermidine synthase [Gemmatimonadota bacterium]
MHRGASARRAGFFCLAFGSGFAVLTIEIAGARLIAPVFGLSAVPWTAVIGVILAALAVGNHLGGRAADAGTLPLSRILFIAALTGVLPVVAVGFPGWAREAFGFIPGAVLSATILFAPSVLCLGAVVPFLIQGDTESLESVGRRSGDMGAAATAGSIAGSFLTGFVLLPLMPLPILLSATAVMLLLLSGLAGRLIGDRVDRAGIAIGLIALPGLGLLAANQPPDTLHAEQTIYSSVAVTERPWRDGRVVRELWQNGGSSSAEYASGEPAHVYAQVSLVLLDEVLGRADAVLVLGGAALTLPVAFSNRRPDASIDVVEIDRAVTRLAVEHFEYGQSPRPRIEVVHDDARVFLRRSDRLYDLVYLDVFDHLLTVPWTMVTVEALGDMSARLGPGGVFAANVLSPLNGGGTEFLERFRATLEAVFAVSRVYVTDSTLDAGATQNLVVMAANDASALPDVDWAQTEISARGRPLTDSWAPVEYLQAKVFAQGFRWN